MTPEQYAANIARALDVQDQSVRLQAAMAAGTHPHPDLLETLVRRCGVEPDFFVRDMLTWALCRLPAALTVPRLRTELQSSVPQARSQALHTLSKIGSCDAWADVVDLVDDPDDVRAHPGHGAAAFPPPADAASPAAAGDGTATDAEGAKHV